MTNPFHFYTRFHLVRLLGLRARTPARLLEGIQTVPDSSIYYHTHRFLQQHHYLSPEPPNDFAYWASNILNMKQLGEALASVDVVRFANIAQLRQEFINILNDHIPAAAPDPECLPRDDADEAAPVTSAQDAYLPFCSRGQEFHFMSCVTFILPTPHSAADLVEFAEGLEKVSISSLYFHVFEARLRLDRDENDFSAWFRDLGAVRLAQEISRLDPYTMTLENLREKIIGMVKKYGQS